jgi:hypothetical protein
LYWAYRACWLNGVYRINWFNRANRCHRGYWANGSFNYRINWINRIYRKYGAYRADRFNRSNRINWVNG